MQFTRIDIFCHIIDNFGDAGVVYRFAKEFKDVHRDSDVRVFIDDLNILQAIEDAISTDCFSQEIKGITWINSSVLTEEHVQNLGIAEIIIEAFACQIPDCYMEKAYYNRSLIINLEYLSAEDWVEGFHLKESLLPKGNSRKYFFMPGFSSNTGGIIFNSRLKEQKSSVVSNRVDFLKMLLKKNSLEKEIQNSDLVGTVFTYQRGFDTFLKNLETLDREILLLVFGEKSQNSMRDALKRVSAVQNNNSQYFYQNISILFTSFLAQDEYDRLLCCTDFNLVRGEDSLARAILAEKPFIWNAYIQEKKYQKVKVEALLKTMQPFFDDEDAYEAYRTLMLEFNNAEFETTLQNTTEDYQFFFQNLNKFEHASSKMCYFIEQNCNLIEKLSGFIRDFQ